MMRRFVVLLLAVLVVSPMGHAQASDDSAIQPENHNTALLSVIADTCVERAEAVAKHMTNTKIAELDFRIQSLAVDLSEHADMTADVRACLKEADPEHHH